MTAAIAVAALAAAALVTVAVVRRRLSRRRVERQLKLLRHPSCVQCRCATERLEFGPHTTSTYVVEDDL